jgi:hypothetical protein
VARAADGVEVAASAVARARGEGGRLREEEAAGRRLVEEREGRDETVDGFLRLVLVEGDGDGNGDVAFPIDEEVLASRARRPELAGGEGVDRELEPLAPGDPVLLRVLRGAARRETSPAGWETGGVRGSFGPSRTWAPV